jgi:lysophospholipase L1-like esterase
VRRHPDLLLLCLALQLVLAGLLSFGWLSYHNTLSNNGRWISTKATMDKALTGAVPFLFRQQPLATGRLNLSAWYGFQEVFYEKPVRLGEIEFDFLLGAHAYLNLLFNRTPDGYSVVRLSANDAFETEWFRASAGGTFAKRRRLAMPSFEAGRRPRLRLRVDEGYVSTFVDGEVATIWREPVAHEQRVGFRGGVADAYVDDIVIRPLDAEPIHESFSNRRHLGRVGLFALLGVIGTHALATLIVWRALRRDPRRVGFTLVVATLVLIVVAVLSLATQRYFAHFYPVANEELRLREAYWKESSREEVLEEIRRGYSAIPDEGVRRILFLGGSQTWGAGASRAEDTFVRQIERMLSKSAPPAESYECINGGIPAHRSGSLLELYETEWIDLRPEIVVVNISTNDPVPAALEANLERMVQLSLEEGISPLLVLEPNSIEMIKQKLTENHAAMQRVAIRYGVPVVDMHSYLAQRYEAGFLWWDFAHLTSFGQRLFAEGLVPPLRKVLKRSR